MYVNYKSNIAFSSDVANNETKGLITWPISARAEISTG